MYMSDVRMRKMSPGPSFSLCLATLLLFLLQVISKRPAAVSISLSLSACPIYTSPYMVTVHILLHVCSDSNIVVSGVPCVVVTCVIRPSSWRQRQGRRGGGDKYEEGKVSEIKNDRKGENRVSGWWKALTGKAREKFPAGCHGWGIKPVFAFNACGQSPIWLKLWNNTQSDSSRNVAGTGFGIRAALSQSPKHATEHCSLRGEA